MHILVTGATGFIASQIITDLLAEGHQVTCCARNTKAAQREFPNATIIAVDFVKDTNSAVWIPRLQNVDVVINCVGILYHPNKKIIWAIHCDTPKALFQASASVGVKKIVQISALGVDRNQVEYAKSKKAADDFLQTLPIVSIILRPSMVFGAGSYGGGSLFRGLAGLPFILPVPGKGDQQIQPIYVKDLSKAISVLIHQQTTSAIFAAVSPQAVMLKSFLATLRNWLNFPKAFILTIPLFLFRLGSWFGNFIPYSVMNSESYAMLQQHNVATIAQSEAFFAAIQFTPREFQQGIYSEPSRVQDRWHARLYFLRPALRIIIALLWIFTALCSIWFYPRTASYQLLASIGINSFWQPILLFGGAIIDGLLGLAMLFNWQIVKVGFLQIVFIIIYTSIITLKLPQLWLDPFAPIAKNIPLIAAILVVMALESDR